MVHGVLSPREREVDRVRVVHRDLVDGTVEPTGANSPKFVQAYAWTLPVPAGGQ